MEASVNAAVGTSVPDPRRWQALALVCVAFFMTVLDVSIVTVALPSISHSLHFSASGLQWVITAYTITFGGFLLLGGRAADLLGRRRIFMSGLALFTLASLVCGLAGSPAVLIAARTVQGIGAAVVSPATLSIITTTFEEGAERNKALGIWGGMGGGGAAAGVLFGGLLTRYLGWAWIFFVNVPVGALVLALSRSIIRESRDSDAVRNFDLPGAVAVTGGLALLVYGISEAPAHGWGAASTITTLTVAAVALAAFVVREARAPAPIMPLSIFRIKTVAGANLASAILGVVVFANFFLLTLYVQNVLRYSALKTGITFLATAGTVVVVAALAQSLTTRYGARIVLGIGFLLMTAGMVVYARIPVHGHYASNLLPGYLLVGVGLAFAFISVSIAALAGVPAHQSGVASGLLNTSQQIGGAIGVAVVSSIALSRANHLLSLGHTAPEAYTSGYALAFWALAGVGVAGLVVTFVLVRPRTEVETVPDSEPVIEVT
jgi:EmrB/QacA subfamily drug resistance transporter